MLEFHIYRGIPFVIVDVVINVVWDVIDDYVMVVFIINTIVYQHEISINELERGSK